MEDLFFWIHVIAFIAVTLYALFLFYRLVKTRVDFIRLGDKPNFIYSAKERWKAVMVNVFGQKKLLKDKKSGIIHVIFFYGFIIVQFSAIDVIWKGLSNGGQLPFGPLYPFFTLSQEIVVLIILFGVVWAFYRRYIEKIVRLKRGWKAGIVLILLSGVMVFKLATKGAGHVWFAGSAPNVFEPASSVIALAIEPMGATAAGV